MHGVRGRVWNANAVARIYWQEGQVRKELLIDMQRSAVLLGGKETDVKAKSVGVQEKLKAEIDRTYRQGVYENGELPAPC
eukprot:1967413-Rhodomonas_salina.1